MTLSLALDLPLAHLSRPFLSSRFMTPLASLFASEVSHPTPDRAEWWNEQSKRCVERARDERELSEGYALRNLRYLKAFPRDFAVVGLEAPRGFTGVTREHVRALKASGRWRASALKPKFAALREALRFAGNSLGDARDPVWRLPAGEEDRRVWIAPADLWSLLLHATGRLRFRVAMQGFNGLREEEVRRLRVRDFDLGLPKPKVRVWGKGRFGGKFRTIPLTPTARPVVLAWVEGRSADERLYAVSHATADGELARLGRECGIAVRVAGHVLRRSFGSFMADAGVPLAVIQRFYGHSSIDQTVWYTGRNLDHMADAAETFEAYLARFRPVSDPVANGEEGA